ncbi:MAG: hypothetical protein O3B84_05435 [Chloroflexi bacterium]|nr:hypothetical protein [Chloroflexota bacterium]
MEWPELEDAMRDLGATDNRSATRFAASGAVLLQRALESMFLGEPESLRRVAWRIAEVRPAVVALRNVGVASHVTAQEARTGNRMAAAGRSAGRLARLLATTPDSLGHRAQSLLRARIITVGSSSGVFAAILKGRAIVQSVGVFDSQGFPAWIIDGLRNEGIQSQAVSEEEIVDVAADADVALIGCVAVLADGSAISRRGTLALANAAAIHHVPLQVFADTLKLAPWLPSAAAREDGWEVIPRALIEHVVTEDGIRRPEQLMAAARDLGPRWEAFDAPADD